MLFLLSDMFSRVLVAGSKRYEKALVLNSKFCICALVVIYDLGYIIGYCVMDIKHALVYLKYIDGRNNLRHACVVSRPSLRVYMSHDQIKRGSVNNYVFMNIFLVCSTSFGFLTDVEVILYRKGGELSFVIC